MIDEIKITTKEEREITAQIMVGLREQGNFSDAIDGFVAIANWDEANQNYTGLWDIYGHLRIAYSKWSDLEGDPTKKAELFLKAEEAQIKVLEILNMHFPEDTGRKAVSYAHGSDLIISKIKNGTGVVSDEVLNRTVQELDYALKNLAGSEAHKAWVYNKIAQLAALTGRTQDAIAAISSGSFAIFTGYEKEMEKPEDGLMKIRIWQSGLWMTQAYLCMQSGKAELARMYFEAVISLEDPTGKLAVRKEEAKQLISKL
jgi:hypothetical protein